MGTVVKAEFRAKRLLTPHDRLEALLAAEMNEEHAELCTKDQPALRTIFEMNAKLFRKLAT